jgi:membrane protein
MPLAARRALDHLRLSRVGSWLSEFVNGLARARTFGLAAEMSFWLFLALVPLAAVAGLGAAKLVIAQPWLAGWALAYVPAQLRDPVHQEVDSVATTSGGSLAPLAALTFLWLAASGVQSVFDALEVQTGTRRPWWKKRLLALATCIGLSLGIAGIALLGAGLDWIQAVAGRRLPPALLRLEHGVLSATIRWTVGAAIAVAMVEGLYRVGVSRTGHRGEPVLPGAAFAVALNSVLGWGYGWYVAHGVHRTARGAYKAGLAIVGVTLMTLWLFAVALLMGAQLNQLLAERLRARRAWQTSVAFSSPPTSRRRRTWPWTGPSSSPPRSAHP